MAWTDQCRIAFKVNADGLLWRQEKQTKKGIMRILARLSEDSGIPQKTLWRWWNEEEKQKEKNLKNEINGENNVSVGNEEEIKLISHFDTADKNISLSQLAERSGMPEDEIKELLLRSVKNGTVTKVGAKFCLEPLLGSSPAQWPQ